MYSNNSTSHTNIQELTKPKDPNIQVSYKYVYDIQDDRNNDEVYNIYHYDKHDGGDQDLDDVDDDMLQQDHDVDDYQDYDVLVYHDLKLVCLWIQYLLIHVL